MGGKIHAVGNLASYLSRLTKPHAPRGSRSTPQDAFQKSSGTLLPVYSAGLFQRRDFPLDVVNGSRLLAFNSALRKKDPLMQLGREELEEHPEFFKTLVAESVALAHKFSDELREGMEAIGLQTKIKGNEKQPSRILEKLSRKTLEKGSTQTLADLGDLCRCRVEVSSVPELYKAAEKVQQMYGERIIEWEDTIAHPRATGYTGRIHITVLNEERTRKLELQIALEDMIKLGHERFPVEEGFNANFHDLIYKGLGGRNPEILGEFYDLHKCIFELNKNGERLESAPHLTARIQRLRERIIALYRSTPRENWPVL